MAGSFVRGMAGQCDRRTEFCARITVRFYGMLDTMRFGTEGG